MNAEWFILKANQQNQRDRADKALTLQTDTSLSTLHHKWSPEHYQVLLLNIDPGIITANQESPCKKLELKLK